MHWKSIRQKPNNNICVANRKSGHSGCRLLPYSRPCIKCGGGGSVCVTPFSGTRIGKGVIVQRAYMSADCGKLIASTTKTQVPNPLEAHTRGATYVQLMCHIDYALFQVDRTKGCAFNLKLMSSTCWTGDAESRAKIGVGLLCILFANAANFHGRTIYHVRSLIICYNSNQW